MLKLIAPFRVLLTLDSSLVAARPGDFTDFLKRLSDDAAKPEGALRRKLPEGIKLDVNIPPATAKYGVESRYLSLDTTGSFYVSPRIFSLRFAPSETPKIAKILEEAAATADKTAAPYSETF